MCKLEDNLCCSFKKSAISWIFSILCLPEGSEEKSIFSKKKISEESEVHEKKTEQSVEP